MENYLNPKPPKKKHKSKPVVNIFIPIKEAMKKVIDEFDSYGYESACQLTQSLYSEDKISLVSKSKIINELSSLQMMTTKQRKFMKKIQYNT